MLEKETAVTDVAKALGIEAIDELIPLPGTKGWELVHIDDLAFSTLDTLRKAYVKEALAEAEAEIEVLPEESAPVEEAPDNHNYGTYGDATIRRHYNESDYSRPITVTLGAHKGYMKWKPNTHPMGAFIARLCRHQVGDKDGPAYVLGDMVPGQRLKTSVKALYAIGLDIDTGTPSEVVNAALDKLGCTAIRYTTHSHTTTSTDFKRDSIAKFAPGETIDDALIRRFLAQAEQWDKSIAHSAVYVGTDHTEKGIVVTVQHRPMPKHRIVIPLDTPFEIGKVANTQKEGMERWAKVPKALSELLGLPFDRSCVDPSRLFYFPRHGKNRAFEIDLWGGPLFDWRTLELDDPMDAIFKEMKSSSKSVTKDGQALGRWAITHATGFQVVDAIEAYAPDRTRGAANGGITIECPFDESHGNAGDRDDKACFAVNAGMGESAIFTVSCRHASCADKTALDMLGKMLQDGWLPKEILDDKSFYASVIRLLEIAQLQR